MTATPGVESIERTALQFPVFGVAGWAGNTVDTDGVEWWVTGEEGWSDGPDVRLELTDRPRRHGAFDTRPYRAPRVITLEGIAVAPDAEARERAKRRLAALLADAESPSPLVVQDRHSRRLARVRLSAGTKITDTTPVTFEWSLQLTAPDPLVYSAAEHRLTTGLARHGEGLAFPLTFPLRFGEPSGGRLVVHNAGTVATHPVWEIAGPCDRPVIENARTGDLLAFEIALRNGEVLVVDTDARTVRLGGTVSRRSALVPGSRWFTLPPGTTEVEFRAWTYDEHARLTVRWRDAWI